LPKDKKIEVSAIRNFATEVYRLVGTRGSGGGGSVSLIWGAITGSIEDQTDLVEYVADKLIEYSLSGMVITDGQLVAYRENNVDYVVTYLEDNEVDTITDGTNTWTYTYDGELVTVAMS